MKNDEKEKRMNPAKIKVVTSNSEPNPQKGKTITQENRTSGLCYSKAAISSCTFRASIVARSAKSIPLDA